MSTLMLWQVRSVDLDFGIYHDVTEVEESSRFKGRAWPPKVLRYSQMASHDSHPNFSKKAFTAQ